MGLFDDFGKRVKEAGQKSVQRTRELSEISHFNILISQAENSINNTYYQIGKKYFDIHRDDDSEEALSPFIASIKDLEKKISNYKKQIQNIRGVQVCNQCGAEIAQYSAFCSSCGAPVPKVQKPQYNGEFIKCDSCGAMVKKGMKFCTACGSSLMSTKTEPEIDSSISQGCEALPITREDVYLGTVNK